MTRIFSNRTLLYRRPSRKFSNVYELIKYEKLHYNPDRREFLQPSCIAKKLREHLNPCGDKRAQYTEREDEVREGAK